MDKMRLIEQADKLLERMQAKRASLANLDDLLKDLLPIESIEITNDLDVMIFTPYTRASFEVWLEWFESHGYIITNVFDERSCLKNSKFSFDPSLDGTKDGIRLHVAFDTHAKGATCYRQLIGKVMVEQPIYEFACTPVESAT